MRIGLVVPIITFYLFYPGNQLFAQGEVDSISTAMYNLKPLHVLIDSALVNSPLMQSQNIQIDISKRKLRIAKKQWLKTFALSSSYSYGRGNNLNLTDGSAVSNLLTTTTQANYNVAATFYMPLTTIFNRKENIELDRLKLNLEKNKKIELENEIRKAIIVEYNNLKFKIKEMNIALSTMESNEVAVELAKTYMDKGAIAINSYTEAVDKRNGTIVAFEKAKMEVTVAYLLLQEITGTQIE